MIIKRLFIKKLHITLHALSNALSRRKIDSLYEYTFKHVYMNREHMPGVSGKIMEKMEGDKYKIIVDDAFKWLKTYK